jgi:triphosphatase
LSWLALQGWYARSDPSADASLEGPVTAFAAAVLEQRYGQVRKRGRKLRGLSPVELHRLRIAIKKFRYAADFFAGLYEAKTARAALKRLSRLQDILGAMNDAAAVADLTSHAFSRVPGQCGLEVRGILLGWSSGQAARLKRELKGAWKEFRSTKKFW